MTPNAFLRRFQHAEHKCVNSGCPLAFLPLRRPTFFEHTLQIGLVSKRGPTHRFLKPLAYARSHTHIAHRGVPHALGCAIYATLLVACVIGTTLAWHGSCISKDHARHVSLPAMPPLRRLRDPVLPSSTTLPPRGTRGLRARPAPGRVPLLMVNRMRYALDMAFTIMARELHDYPSHSMLPSRNVLSLVYRVSVIYLQQGVFIDKIWSFA